MGMAMDVLKFAGKDTWRDSTDWIMVEGHSNISFSGGQWVQTKLKADGELTVEKQYLLAINRAAEPMPVFIWYTRAVGYRTYDKADFEIIEKPVPTDRFDDKTPEQIAAFFEKNDYKKVY